MAWLEKDQTTDQIAEADAERAKLLNEVKKGSLPTIRKESELGAPPFKELELQPVKSPGIYEAEFGVKDANVIFHFWPWGYHAADVAGRATPKFSKDFLPKLTRIMGETFDPKRVEIKEDPDVGAIFVKALSWGESQFHRELSVKACEALHKALGGTS